MEQFIEHGEMLLNRFEWFGGIIPKPKDVKARRKLIKNGDAVIVVEADWTESSEKRNIQRKR